MDILLSLQNSTLDGVERAFSILDANGTTASGIAAAVVDPDNGHCVITAQAAG